MDSLPAWAIRALGTDGQRRIEDAIERAESNTSGEIVPVLVRRSSTVGHVPILAFALLLLAAYLLDLPALLTPRPDQMRQVDLRAQVEFYELDLAQTEARTGVLLLVSLMEHRAVVLADHGISQKLEDTIWQEVVDLMINGVKSGDLAGGMCSAIDRCGELLASHFPIADGDINELHDHLIVKE